MHDEFVVQLAVPASQINPHAVAQSSWPSRPSRSESDFSPQVLKGHIVNVADLPIWYISRCSDAIAQELARISAGVHAHEVLRVVLERGGKHLQADWLPVILVHRGEIVPSRPMATRLCTRYGPNSNGPQCPACRTSTWNEVSSFRP